MGLENLSTASLRPTGCFPAEPCPRERHWGRRQGQAVVARLFVPLKIFTAVVGQLFVAWDPAVVITRAAVVLSRNCPASDAGWTIGPAKDGQHSDGYNTRKWMKSV